MAGLAAVGSVSEEAATIWHAAKRLAAEVFYCNGKEHCISLSFSPVRSWFCECLINTSSCRSDKESTAHSRVASINSANYLDIRAVTANLETRGYHSSPSQSLHVKHIKEESRDSAGSRSSGHGSLDGQGSENFAARTDTMSSEGFVSGDDRHGRPATKDNIHNKGKYCS